MPTRAGPRNCAKRSDTPLVFFATLRVTSRIESFSVSHNIQERNIPNRPAGVPLLLDSERPSQSVNAPDLWLNNGGAAAFCNLVLSQAAVSALSMQTPSSQSSPLILASASRATLAHDSGKFSLSHRIRFSALRSLNSPSCRTTTSARPGRAG